MTIELDHKVTSILETMQKGAFDAAFLAVGAHRGKREDEGVLVKWLSTIKQVDEGRLVVERMELDESGFPQATG